MPQTNDDGSEDEEKKVPCQLCGSKEPWKVWHDENGEVDEVVCPGCGWDGVGRPWVGR